MKLEDIQILKSCFTMTTGNDLTINFSIKSFQPKSNKFMMKPIDSVY